MSAKLQHFTPLFCGILIAGMLPPVVAAADDEFAAEEERRQWFEHCLGTYQPDADWFQACEDELGPAPADCQAWVACLEGETEFVQTRTCSPTGGPNPCSANEHPHPVQWYHRDVDYRINIDGSQHLHPDETEVTDELRNDIISTFDVWNEVSCSDFQMHFEGTTPHDPPPFYNETLPPEENEHVVTFRDDRWPHAYDAVALTTVTFRHNSGEILSADIELNTAEYEFTQTDDGDDIVIDLRNTMAHEAGHFLGLDHSPNTEATMYGTAAEGETKKRHLHPADIEGLCHIYPEGEGPSIPQNGNENDGNTRSGCGCYPAAGGSAVPIAAVVLLFGMNLVIRRRDE